MKDLQDIISQNLPRKISDGKVSLHHERADKIIKDLEDSGYIIVRSEVMGVLRNAINMLVSAEKLTPSDRQRIADSAISTVWGGFYPVETKGD
jgi:hypothetical protein